MTDAQYLFDLATKQYNKVADKLERQLDNAAFEFRDWLPESLQPRPPPPPASLSIIPTSYFVTLQQWVSRNRILAAGVLAFLGTGATILYLQRPTVKPRRATRAPNGSRSEIVIVVGQPSAELTTSVALNLDRKGFLVYVVANSSDDERHIRGLSRIDIVPLTMNASDPEGTQTHISRLQSLLAPRGAGDQHHATHAMSLSGIVIIADHGIQVLPVVELTSREWSETLNVNVLRSITNAGQLLPLVTDHCARVVYMTPCANAVLSTPHHALGNVATKALDAYADTLAAELHNTKCGFSKIVLGHTNRRSMTVQDSSALGPVLHNTVYDALTTTQSHATWRVGHGSLAYPFIAAIAPARLISWMVRPDKRMHLTPHRTQSQRAPVSSDGEQSDSSAQWEKIGMVA